MMKKLILIPLFLFLFPVICNGQVLHGIIGGGGTGTAGAGACSCSASPLDEQAYANALYPIGSANPVYYGGTTYTPSAANKQICKVKFGSLGLGDGSLDGKVFTVKVWATDGSKNLTTQNGGTSNSITCKDGGTLGTPTPDCDEWDDTDVDFTWSADYPTVTTGTLYAITIDMGGVDGSNYANFARRNETAYTGGWAAWGNDKTLNDGGADANDAKISIYVCE